MIHHFVLWEGLLSLWVKIFSLFASTRHANEVSVVHRVITLRWLPSVSDFWHCIFICMWKVWRKNNLMLKIENWRWKQKLKTWWCVWGSLQKYRAHPFKFTYPTCRHFWSLFSSKSPTHNEYCVRCSGDELMHANWFGFSWFPLLVVQLPS